MTSTVYLGSDGYWHGRVTMGIRDDGKPDRRHVQSKDESEVRRKVRELENARDNGTARKPGERWKAGQWLTHWVENIAPLTCRYKTMAGYRTAVYLHLVPGIGDHWMDKIEPGHFEKLYRLMQAPPPKGKGLKAGTAHQAHRTARTAWREAQRRKIVIWNAAELAKAPRIEEDEIEPFSSEEITAIVAAALKRRNGVRYVVGLALGCRQGEALGFRWDRLDRKKKVYRVKSALQRQTWQHGCDNPHKCGTKYHKAKPCREGCKRHTRSCPPPCPPDCTGHARWCPQRHSGGLVEVPVKSRAGNRSLTLPEELFGLLLRHEEAQKREREHAGTEWHESEWMFTQANGVPIDPRRDLDEWKAILGEAGVRDARLHDARHTAATVLLLLGVDKRVVMEVMGWSTITMAERYMHVTEELRHDVARQLNDYFWKAGVAEPDVTDTELNVIRELTGDQIEAIRRLGAALPEVWGQRITRLLNDPGTGRVP